MDSVDLLQGKKITYLVAFVTLLTGVVGVLAYIETKKHHKLNDEVLHLDKQIKTMELAIKKNQARESGVI